MQATNCDWADAAEARLVDAARALASERAFDEGLLAAALAAADLTPVDGRLLAPEGLRDVAALLFQRHDDEALAALETLDAGALKIRERIFEAVSARVEAAARDEAVVRAASKFLARPSNLLLAARLGWRTADRLWRWAGDTSTDENHYSKRAILAGVLASTVQVRLAKDPAAAQAHLRARIEDVMSFERFKSKLPRPSTMMETLAAELGRRRYGVSSS